MVKLSSRLQIVYDFIPQCTCLADVGCDHGYLSIAAASNGRCSKAIAMDINKGPLQKASENIRIYKLTDSIELRLSDGLKGLEEGEADVICICGMGGVLMKRILANDMQKSKSAKTLILEPQSEYEELRIFLDENGFFFEDEALVTEENKIYPVFKVGFDGKDQRLSPLQRKFGPVILEKRPKLFEIQLLKLKEEDERILKKLLEKQSKEKVSEQINQRIIALKEELTQVVNAQAYFGGK